VPNAFKLANGAFERPQLRNSCALTCTNFWKIFNSLRLLGKAAGFKGGIFFQGAWAKKRGQKRLGKRGKKKEQPFRFFWATAKKTEKLRQKKIALPQPQITELPLIGWGEGLKSTAAYYLAVKARWVVKGLFSCWVRGMSSQQTRG
jgi:hypothetical protein